MKEVVAVPYDVEPAILWRPSAERVADAEITRYLRWLQERRGLKFDGYNSLWKWSVDQPEDFWGSLWDFFDIQASRPYEAVLVGGSMPGVRWFPGARLNFVEQVFRYGDPTKPAILFASEDHDVAAISWLELRRQVGAFAASLRGMGVGPGDRVVGYLPNIPQAVVAFLASASIGAVWTACAPDFGTLSVLDRFRQLEPTVLVAVDGYHYGGRELDRRAVVAELRKELPSLTHTVLVSQLGLEPPAGVDALSTFEEMIAQDREVTFAQVPSDHPLWVLFSSGTTGLPKGIVHSHAGALLEHLKVASLGIDLTSDDCFFWFTSTSWVMWNLVVSGLLVGATIVLYDGSPSYPDLGRLWQLAQECQITSFGTSAASILACAKANLRPGESYRLSSLRSIGSTGSPLPPSGFRWVYQAVKSDLWLYSISGGTDIAGALVGGSVTLPVWEGEIQARCLGARVEAWNEAGQPLLGELGELVVTGPMPSMPIYFWNDPDGTRYHDAYFDTFPGVWRHGDWITITERGTAIIHGRSDSTLNRMGVRMGTADIYEAVERLPEVREALVIGAEQPDGSYWMPLFVVLESGRVLDDPLRERINDAIRSGVSPRHVPDEIIAVGGIPHTLTGKKLEVPVKRLLQGTPVASALSLGAIDDPSLVSYFVDLGRARSTHHRQS
ncbi:MAG: acetoacetate--CoA ligase [Acidimicrobiales bacterium]